MEHLDVSDLMNPAVPLGFILRQAARAVTGKRAQDLWKLATYAEDGYAPAKYLSDSLGRSWAVCRATPNNKMRYGNCVSKSTYARAKRAALDAWDADTAALLAINLAAPSSLKRHA